MNKIPAIKRHSWINYPTVTTRKCTRCGLIRYTSGGNSPVYYRGGVKLDERPDCITIDSLSN